MPLDPQLLEILACPQDKGPLFYLEDEESLVNLRLRRRYRIEGDIPVMLIDEAEALEEDEFARIEAKIADEGITPTFDPESSTGSEER